MVSQLRIRAQDYGQAGLVPVRKGNIGIKPMRLVANLVDEWVESAREAPGYTEADGTYVASIPDGDIGFRLKSRIVGAEEMYFLGYPAEVNLAELIDQYRVSPDTFQPFNPPSTAADVIARANTAVTVATGAAGDADAAATAASGAAVDAQQALTDLTSQKGAPSGIAPLDGSGKLPEPQVPDRLSEAALSSTYVTPVQVSAAVAPKLDAASAVATYNTKTDVQNARGIRRGPAAICLGDSISNNLSNLTDPTQPVIGEGWMPMACLLSGQRIAYARNSGVTNNTVQDMAARLQADVIAYNPNRCIILAGTNNTNLIGPTDPTITQSMVVYEQSIIQPLLAAGIEPIICTIPPRSGSRTADPATYKKTAQWNVFLRTMANRYRLLIVDTYAALADPTTGDYKAGLSGDGVHPNKAGMLVLAQTVVAAVLPSSPAKGVPLELDRYSAINLAPNPLFLEGLGGTGNILPTGWSGSTTGVTVTLTDPVANDGLEAGKWFNIVKTDAATTKNINFIRSFATLATAGNPVATGDLVSWAFRYSLSGSSGVLPTPLTYLTVALRYTNSGGTNVKIITPMSQFEENSSGVLYWEAPVPATAANIRLDLSFSAASVQTLAIGQVTMLNLTALGLPSMLRSV